MMALGRDEEDIEERAERITNAISKVCAVGGDEERAVLKSLLIELIREASERRR